MCRGELLGLGLCPRAMGGMRVSQDSGAGGTIAMTDDWLVDALELACRNPFPAAANAFTFGAPDYHGGVLYADWFMYIPSTRRDMVTNMSQYIDITTHLVRIQVVFTRNADYVTLSMSLNSLSLSA